ncbi:MAG: hypothetical protein WBV06_04235, partial [Acidimicrobiia bacterium]
MSERDIRNSFQHLQEDVMSNVETEKRLAHITDRRRRLRPALTAFAGAAAVVLAVGATLFLLRPSGPTDTLPPVTEITVAPTTNRVPTTSEATTTTNPENALPTLSNGTVVIAAPDLAPSSPQGVEVSVVVGRDGTAAVRGDRVVGDGSGGLFVQSGGNIEWWRPDGTRTTLVDPTFTGSRVELRLEDVAVVDGETNVIFIAAGGENLQRYEEVWRYDVATATPTMIYHTGAYEGGIRRASLAGNLLVVTRAAEGYTWFLFFDADGNPVDVHNPKPDGAEAPIFVDQGVLSPDGATLAYLESDLASPADDNTWPMDVVVWDLATGTETSRTPVGLGTWFPDRMDFDGNGVVLGRIRHGADGDQTGAPLQV